jgi:hypothetical protein
MVWPSQAATNDRDQIMRVGMDSCQPSLSSRYWPIRNSRTGNAYNPAALLVVLDAAEKLLKGGEDLRDVLEAFAELLVHP